MSGAEALNVRGVYAIVDAAVQGVRGVADAACAAEAAGAAFIQLRMKASDSREYLEVAEQCCRRLRDPSLRLWVNDRVEIACLLPVCGVHLGQHDLPPAAARRILPPERLVGLSTHDLRQVREAEQDAAVDIVAFGPVLSTRSKRDAEPSVGWEGLAQARQHTSKPLVAIGGLGADEATYLEARRRGADLVAMIGALGTGAQVKRRCREFQRLEEHIAKGH